VVGRKSEDAALGERTATTRVGAAPQEQFAGGALVFVGNSRGGEGREDKMSDGTDSEISMPGWVKLFSYRPETFEGKGRGGGPANGKSEGIPAGFGQEFVRTHPPLLMPREAEVATTM